MSKILSFDVSSVSTGWAFIFEGNLQSFGKIEPDRTFMPMEKLCWFKHNVTMLLKVYQPDYVIVEETYLKNVKTLKTLMYFIAILAYTYYEVLDKDVVFTSPLTVRSHFKLKTKEDVFEYVSKKYKVKLKNYTFETGNDITDAVLQGLYWYDVLTEEGESDE